MRTVMTTLELVELAARRAKKNVPDHLAPVFDAFIQELLTINNELELERLL